MNDLDVKDSVLNPTAARLYLRSHLSSVQASQQIIGVVLGSGLGHWVDSAQAQCQQAGLPFGRCAYADIPGLPKPKRAGGVQGHSKQVSAWLLPNQRCVVAFEGRFHAYEGYNECETTAAVQVLQALGASTVIITNAAGGINSHYALGDLVLLKDHLNLTGRNPLIGQDNCFVDMSAPYDVTCRNIAMQASKTLGYPLKEGVYAGVLGPSYETPAEVAMLKAMGADLVGMSTVLEVIMARYLGLRVLGLSCVTNAASGLGETPLNHKEVLDVTRQSAQCFSNLMDQLVLALPA